MEQKNWELIHLPTLRDKNRHLLRINIDENKLLHIFRKTNLYISRPVPSEDKNYKWEVFIYALTPEEYKNLTHILEEFFKSGTIEYEEEKEKGKEIQHTAAQPQQDTFPQATPSTFMHKVSLEEGIPAATEAPPVAHPTVVSMSLNPKYTFENFVVGPNNRFVHAAAVAVANNPGKVYNPLFIYGNVGLGKTHIMQAIAHHVLKNFPEAKIVYTTAERFTSEVIDAISHGTLQVLRDKYCAVDLLLIDDIQFLSESESTQEEFFHIFNVLYENGKQLVITSDRPPKLLTVLADRLRSRFEWGLIADIKSPSLETRIAILKRKSLEENLNLDENILLFIGGKLKSNIRELEGCLKRIKAYAEVTGQNITLEMVKEVIRDLLPPEELEELKEQMPPTPTTTTQQQIPSEIPIPKQVFPQQQTPPPLIPTTTPKMQSPTTIPPITSTPKVSTYFLTTPQKEKPKILQQEQQISPVAVSPEKEQPLTEETIKYNTIPVAIFYPEGKEQELVFMKNKFREVIKKHKLKTSIESLFERPYMTTGKINYAFFVELCKTNNAKIAIVLGPPPDSDIDPQEFCNTLTAIMEDSFISLQYISFSELNKEYKYLNSLLDMTLMGR